MRNNFASKIHELMKFRDDVVLIYGDIGNNLFNKIKNDFPNRIENVGIAESSMVGVAAGISKAGYVPICYTINSFLYLKAIEQIKLDLAYPSRQVLLVGTGGGLSYASLGTSHHSLEDYAILGSIPNLRLYSPADSDELNLSIEDAMKYAMPTYIRIGKKGEKNLANHLTSSNSLFNDIFREIHTSKNSELAVITVGPIGQNIREILDSNQLIKPFDFYSLYQIEPWDQKIISDKFSQYKKILIIEEHYSFGGAASRVIESIANAKMHCEVYGLGLPHEYFTGFAGRKNIESYSKMDYGNLISRINELS